MPVYPLTAGLTQRDMARVTEAALDAVPGDWPDPLPERPARQIPPSGRRRRARRHPSPEKQGRCERSAPPHGVRGAVPALLRPAAAQGAPTRGQRHCCYREWTVWRRSFAALPFAPTRRTAPRHHGDRGGLRLRPPMNRLVQGDVGSGKTVVAAALCALAAQNGWQAAFMAPTEILAAQHAETLSPMLGKLGLTCTLLTGSMTAAQKRAALAAIESGAANVVVGTHALIQQSVVFHRLGAVIADEQHRFGVAQRAALSAKGEMPHVLVMSATPIPRTLALIMYGDLDVSVLDEIAARQKSGRDLRRRARTCASVSPPSSRSSSAAGGQAYIVLSARRGQRKCGSKAQKRRAAREGPAGAAAAPPRGSAARTHEKRRKRRRSCAILRRKSTIFWSRRR